MPTITACPVPVLPRLERQHGPRDCRTPPQTFPLHVKCIPFNVAERAGQIATGGSEKDKRFTDTWCKAISEHDVKCAV